MLTSVRPTLPERLLVDPIICFKSLLNWCKSLCKIKLSISCCLQTDNWTKPRAKNMNPNQALAVEAHIRHLSTPRE